MIIHQISTVEESSQLGIYVLSTLSYKFFGLGEDCGFHYGGC